MVFNRFFARSWAPEVTKPGRGRCMALFLKVESKNYNSMIKKSLFLTFVSAFLFFASCEEEITQINTQQKDAAEDQSIVDGYFNEANDMSTRAFQTPSAADLSGRANGKTITITVTGDTRFNGATVTLESTSTNAFAPQGKITVDFGAGKTDPNGVTRKGKMILTYSGLRFLPESFTELTFDNYFINNVKIEGKRRVTTTVFDNTGITFNVKDTGGKATFADGKIITREATLIQKLIFGGANGQPSWSVSGTASGTTRESKNYQLVIEKALVYKAQCIAAKIVVPVEGIAILTVDGIVLTVDYGNGECDNKATLTVAGITQEITITE